MHSFFLKRGSQEMPDRRTNTQQEQTMRTSKPKSILDHKKKKRHTDIVYICTGSLLKIDFYVVNMLIVRIISIFKIIVRNTISSTDLHQLNPSCNKASI